MAGKLMLDLAQFHQIGFAIIDGVINERDMGRVIGEIANAPQCKAVKRKGQQVYAIRDLLNIIPAARIIAESTAITDIVHQLIGEAEVTRGVLFDKIPMANWQVDWHQDLVVAVKERKEVSGFEAWSIKSGIHHVIPPVAVLQKMLTVRIHLDDVDEHNGALWVIPESHRYGRLNDEALERWQHRDKILCRARKGSVLIMRPLLLHASYAGDRTAHRRVMHLEFSPDRLPGGLQWYGA